MFAAVYLCVEVRVHLCMQINTCRKVQLYVGCSRAPWNVFCWRCTRRSVCTAWL